MPGQQKLDQNYKLVSQNVYDPSGAQFVSPQGGLVKTGTDNTLYAPIVQTLVDGYKATYRASIAALAAVTGCTDLFTLTGSATKTVRITRVEFSGTVATAALYLDVQAVIRSTANATGTSTSPTIVPLDSADPAATAVVKAYTANPGTLGTLVGNIRSDKVLLPLTGTPIMPDRLVWEFGNRAGTKAVVLRGATQVFALNLNSVTLANATLLDVAIEFTEE